MKKLIISMIVCFTLLGVTGCGCGRTEDRNSAFYKKELTFDFDNINSMSLDIREAIEQGIKDAMPIKMIDGHFRIERNNYSYDYGEGTTKAQVNFYNFEIDARPNEKSSHVLFKGLIKIDFESIVDGSEYGGNYTINNKNHKEIEFEIDTFGKSLYDDKTGNFTIIIPELKEAGTITQTSQSTTTTKSGSKDVSEPKTNTWNIDDTWENVKISFVPYTESK